MSSVKLVRYSTCIAGRSLAVWRRQGRAVTGWRRSLRALTRKSALLSSGRYSLSLLELDGAPIPVWMVIVELQFTEKAG